MIYKNYGERIYVPGRGGLRYTLRVIKWYGDSIRLADSYGWLSMDIDPPREEGAYDKQTSEDQGS